MSALVAGESGTTSVSITLTTVGAYYMRVCADSADEVSESDETDNCNKRDIPLKEDWQKVEVLPVGSTIGSCGTDPAHYVCVSGVSENNANNISDWTWSCKGSIGGNNIDDDSCSELKKKPGFIER